MSDHLTPAIVRKRVREIAELRHDAERAHAAEDELWLGVLLAVANGHPQSSKLAAEALNTVTIQFVRFAV
jgi:hypothetical protein